MFCIHLIVSQLHSSEKFITRLTKYDQIQLKVLMGTLEYLAQRTKPLPNIPQLSLFLEQQMLILLPIRLVAMSVTTSKCLLFKDKGEAPCIAAA